MPELRFSILIPSYNHARHVAAAVESCLAQDFPAEQFETIVVDDGSTDNSREVLGRFRGDRRVRLIEQANAGQAAAIATAFSASSGELVCLLDCDDLFEPGKLRALDAAMSGAEDGLLCHDLEVFRDSDGASLGSWWRLMGVPAEAGELTPGVLAAAPHAFPFSNPCGMACGRSMLERALRSMVGSHWRVGVDNILGWSLFVLGGRVRYLPRMLGRYRLHDANTYLALVGGNLRGRRAWQNGWPRLLSHIESLVAGAALPQAERLGWSGVVHRFRPVAEDGRSTRPDELPDRAALATWARELLAHSTSVREPGIAEMEAWARSLLGLAFLGDEAGAAAWSERRERLARGVAPGGAGAWGPPADYDQRIVELADIALALCLAQAQLWDPLPAQAKQQVLDYLRAGYAREVHANNWLWFRVAIGVALDRLGGEPDRGRLDAALDQVEGYAAAGGWYRDGASGPCDHYNAWTFHFHALVYARLDPKADAERCKRLHERAASFAHEYCHWFSPGGAALAYGRSASYRFAVAGFWALLAWSGAGGLAAGELKGLALRNLRWWKLRHGSGPLGVGHAYPNAQAGEFYISEGSPYAAARGFAALLMPESHEFWQATEAPHSAGTRVRAQADPGLLFWRSGMGAGLVNALCAGPAAPTPRVHRAAAYSRFCYSSHFGFGAADDSLDSTLALSLDGRTWRSRGRADRSRVEPGMVYSEWRPWDGLLVRTWLAPAGAWHVRIHAFQCDRPLHSAEGGFALGHADDVESEAAAGEIFVRSRNGSVGALELAGARGADLGQQPPNANLAHPRSVVPLLRGVHAAGTTWLVGAYLGTREGFRPPAPRVQALERGFVILDAGGHTLLRIGPRAAP